MFSLVILLFVKLFFIVIFLTCQSREQFQQLSFSKTSQFLIHFQTTSKWIPLSLLLYFTNMTTIPKQTKIILVIIFYNLIFTLYGKNCTQILFIIKSLNYKIIKKRKSNLTKIKIDFIIQILKMKKKKKKQNQLN